MEKRSVLICEYCGKVIDQEDQFVHDVERKGNQINHDAYYHQECFINSMIKDLEELGFEIIRPRSEINHTLNDSDVVDKIMKTAAPLLDAVLSQADPITPQPKEDFKSPNHNNGKKESKKKSVSTRKKR